MNYTQEIYQQAAERMERHFKPLADLTPSTMKVNGRYNWKNQPERLMYLGRNWAGNGYWHQFAKVDCPAEIWCEVLDSDLHMLEETKETGMEASPGKELNAHPRTPQFAAAARVAGEWWAERLSPEWDDRRAAFSKAVERRVLQELRGESHWDWFGNRQEGRGYTTYSLTENDYDPHYCLIPALAEALPDVSHRERRDALPPKHTLKVYFDRISPKEGYGNWLPDILVPAT